ncbi:MAG TPA: pilus assembly protein N-terminal domain-containing protein [Magnetospirillum sp.]|nr:pilus assembly protein N-terminal domain-containing protein [Magnetospirillum sp.]
MVAGMHARRTGLAVTAMVCGMFASGLSAQAGGAPVEVGNGHAVVLMLPQAAHQVIIGDPGVADVTVESPRQVVVFGKRTGATSLTVLGSGNTPILDVPVVVHAAGAGGVTVTYGASKDGKLGGQSVVFACGTTGCTRATEGSSGAAK